jgi:hypothetical protein
VVKLRDILARSMRPRLSRILFASKEPPHSLLLSKALQCRKNRSSVFENQKLHDRVTFELENVHLKEISKTTLAALTRVRSKTSTATRSP